MTKEELKQEAEDKAGIYFNNLEVDRGNVSDTPFSGYDVFVAYKKGALDSAEPREKRIAELEHQLTHRNCLDCSNHSSKLRMRTLELESQITKLRIEYERQIVKLQKENAELKKQLEMSNKVYNNNLDYSHHIEGQLTNAKEIISEYINILKGDTKNWKKTQEKAEQFLKDCEVEK